MKIKSPFNVLLLQLIVLSQTACLSSGFVIPFKVLLQHTIHQGGPSLLLQKNSRNCIRKTWHRASHLLGTKRDDDLVDQIISPFENIIQLLATPIEPIALPIIYPLTIILFNIAFNSSTSTIFDITFVMFYALVQQLKKMDAGDDEEAIVPAPILDAITLFAASASSIIISPDGFEPRTTFGGISLLLLIVSFVSIGFVASSVLGGKNVVDELSDKEVDPSQRLLEIFDEKLDKE